MNTRALSGLCALALLLPAACTQFPALDSRATPEMLAAQYPALVPVDPLLAQATAGQVDTGQTEQALAARVAGLQARAARLRGSVLTGVEKQRLSQGLR
ncbi:MULTISPECIES: hypothetical protein [unclassified Sulfitobacter]|jgi:hypothetical protein|uniref:hypothetical protein n=1 Tax=unclassified Sulfitobacter TaxID=196795 RepID=UPI001592B11E|nr:hypothetical protein [Sulfitobacter sp. HGT1]MBQ0803834.1 hypothetical protein [Sulfitobacter sp.]